MYYTTYAGASISLPELVVISLSVGLGVALLLYVIVVVSGGRPKYLSVGSFRYLFTDFWFDKYITRKVASLLYLLLLGVFFASLTVVFVVDVEAYPFLAIVPLAGAGYLVLGRIIIELTIALIKVAENTGATAQGIVVSNKSMELVLDCIASDKQEFNNCE